MIMIWSNDILPSGQIRLGNHDTVRTHVNDRENYKVLLWGVERIFELYHQLISLAKSMHAPKVSSFEWTANVHGKQLLAVHFNNYGSWNDYCHVGKPDWSWECQETKFSFARIRKDHCRNSFPATSYLFWKRLNESDQLQFRDGWFVKCLFKLEQAQLYIVIRVLRYQNLFHWNGSPSFETGASFAVFFIHIQAWLRFSTWKWALARKSIITAGQRE